MFEYFSVMEKISEKLNKPYASKSSTFFILEKNNCYIKVRFEEDFLIVHGFVGGAGLCLDSKSLTKFMLRLRELSSIHDTAQTIIVEVEPASPEFSKELYPVFPRINYGARITDIEKILSFVEGTYKVLMEIRKIVDEFRVKDKSFESLEKLWRKMLSSSDKNEKGRLLEEILSFLIGKDENFIVRERNLRTESEEIDIIAENTGMTRFYSQLKCPIILYECKNWSSKIGSKEIRDFAQKIQNRPRLLCSVGVLVTVSKLTKDASTELVGYRGKDFLIAILERKDVETILDKRLPLGGVLRDAIIKAGLR